MTARLPLQALAEAFETLVDLPAEERRQWIEGNVPHVRDRARLFKMLEADDTTARSFLDAPALSHAQVLREDDVPQSDSAQLIGQQVGQYRIERLVGQGGMAAVFAARRVGVDFEQTVAIKLLRRGLYSTVEQNLFRRERQLLAGLTHPNIARLIDGGITEQGIPYLVIEFVDGARLDAYVEANQLDVRARLELFVKVAGAVDAAHRALIVHRDIKPANILVTADGTPKLLDFGVAKMVDEEAAHQTLTTALTPSYASPEQLRGRPITTAADVYSLGVVLHELLTGDRPAGPDPDAPSVSIAASHQRREGGPPLSARQLRRALRGDLDTIVQRALRTRSELRYASVAAFSDDVQRYLDGRPVLAHPPSRRYVVGKFLRRHRLAFALVSGLTVAMVGSLVGVLWQARKTHVEAVRANAVRDFIVDIFRTAEQDRPEGERVKPEEVVDYGMRRVMDDGALPEESRLELVGVLSTVAASMGARDQMDTLTAEGMTIAGRMLPEDDLRWIDVRRRRALVLIDLGRPSEAVDLLSPFEEDWLRMDVPSAMEALMILARARDAHSQAGYAERNTILLRRLRESAERNPRLSSDLVFDVMTNEADQLAAIHQFKEALERGEAAERYWREQQLTPKSRMIWLYGAIGNAASSLGDAERGEAAYRSAIDLSERIHKGPHADTAWFVGLLGSYLVSQNRLEEAEPYVVQGLAMRRQLVGEASPQAMFALNALSRLRSAQKRDVEAMAALDEGVSICARAALDHDACANLLQNRGRGKIKSGQLSAARADLEASIAMQIRITGADSPKLASRYAFLAEVVRLEGRYEQSIAMADMSLDLMKRSGGGHWTHVAAARLQRAWSNLMLGNADAAFREMAEEEPRVAEVSARNVKMRSEMKHVSALALERLGRADEARQMAIDALDLDPSGEQIDAATLSALRMLAGNRATGSSANVRR